ncbi:MAG: replicative DNA helicase [Pseudomonadales bacterium]|jgi:replicative DNA helicase
MHVTDIDRETASIKVPPQSLEAEQAVLGGLLLENEAWDKVSESLTDGDFYRHEHQLIFRMMAKVIERGSPLDVITLSEALDKVGDLEAVGGLSYLGELASNTPSASNIRAYAEIIRERSILRQLVTVANEIADDAFDTGGRNSSEVLDEAERKVFQIAEARPNVTGPQPINPVITKAIERIDELYQSDSAITGLSTGFSDIDMMTAGLQPSDLIIIAGRPSMGKTTFAMNIVEHAVISNEKPVVVFSMEMPADALVNRMLSSLGRINQTKMRTGQLDDDDWPRLTSAVSLLKDRPLFIDDNAALSPTEVRSRSRRIAREHGPLGLIMIDYLQLMQVKGFAENRAGEISEISRSLKALAKELSVPVIALSQLNRSLEQRPNKRPVMSDLRESGSIEQDADVIAFIYRDEVYNEDSPDKGVAEIIIGKQRNGPIGIRRLAFIGKYTKFEDLAHDSYEDFE